MQVDRTQAQALKLLPQVCAGLIRPMPWLRFSQCAGATRIARDFAQVRGPRRGVTDSWDCPPVLRWSCRSFVNRTF